MNLVILYPHYFFHDVTFIGSTGTQGGAENMITGSRQDYFQRTDEIDSITASSNVTELTEEEKKGDYLYCAGLNLVTDSKNNKAELTIQGSSSSDFSTDLVTTSSGTILTSDLMGARKEDYVLEHSGGQVRNYWRAVISNDGGVDVKIGCRLLFLGKMFYFGVEPLELLEVRLRKMGRRQIREVIIRFHGVSESKYQFFYDKIEKHRAYNPIILHTREDHRVLFNEKVFPCFIWQVRKDRPTQNVVNVDLTLRETI